jgi:HlyD family secretion protein
VAQENARAAAAEAELARSEYQRRKRLCEVSCVSREELDQAATRMRSTAAASRSAAFAVDVAAADLEAARTALEYSAAGDPAASPEMVAVRAPVDGRVLGIERKSEGVVGAGEALLEIGNPRALEVTVDVLSADAVRIQPNMPVRFERWGGEGDLAGIVRTVEPTGFTKVSALGVEEQRVLVVADLTSPAAAWERLGDGYRVEAVFLLWQGTDVLQVPASALFRVGSGWAAFAVEDGRAVRRSVEVGHRNGLIAEVRGGLAEGGSVIVHPDDAIADGARVRARNQHGG